MASVIYAHRGASGYAPENTLESFKLATVTVQKAAFATGVLPNIYAFHRYTRNSASLSCTLSQPVLDAVPKLSPGVSHLT